MKWLWRIAWCGGLGLVTAIAVALTSAFIPRSATFETTWSSISNTSVGPWSNVPDQADWTFRWSTACWGRQICSLQRGERDNLVWVSANDLRGQLNNTLQLQLRQVLFDDVTCPDVPPWVLLPDRPDTGSSWATSVSGWPARCLRSFEIEGTVAGAGAFRATRLWPNDFIPLVPYPPGFAADTALYGLPYAAIWIAVLAHRAVRQRRWRNHGRCPRCVYDLRGDLQGGCPECGWNRAREAAF